MINALSGDYFLNNRAYLIKKDTDKRILFKFGDVEMPRSSYNQVGVNIVSQRIDRKIETNWNLDFNIKDIVEIGSFKFIIAEIPPFKKLNPLSKFDKMIELWLVQLAN